MAWDRINKLPELQNKFVKGNYGGISSSAAGTSGSWGANVDTLYWDGSSTNIFDSHGNIIGASSKTSKSIKFEPYDNVKDFFQTGFSLNNALSIDGATDNLNYRFSGSNFRQTGIVPNSGLNKTTFSVSSDAKITDKFTMGTSMNYINSVNKRTQMGSNLSGIMLGLLRTPISFDNSNGLDDAATNPLAYEFAENGYQRTYRGLGYVEGGGYYDNPYWTINKNKFSATTNHLIGNIHAGYKINSWLDLFDRLGTDYYNTASEQFYGVNSAAFRTGQVYFANESNHIINNDLILNANKKLSDNLNTSLMLGWNIIQERAKFQYTEGDGLTIPNFYHISNAQTVQAKESTKSLMRKSGFYGQAKTDYKGFLFVDISGRFEQSSTFMPQNLGNFFYPAINTAFAFTDAIKYFKEHDKILSFGKIRASYASVGKEPSVYSTITTYGNTSVADGWTVGEPFPYAGVTGYQHGGSSGIYNYPNLKPEITTTGEIGLDLRFFKGRIGIDYTYYKNHSKNLLFPIAISRASGYSALYANSGKLWSEGHEIMLSLVPVKTKNFRWESNINWSKNVTYCPSLADGIDKVTLNGFEGSVVVVAAGQRYGVFEGGKFLRDANGNVVINDDPTNPFYGKPVADPNVGVIANLSPKWMGGWLNSFTYKNFNLTFLFDTKQGGKIWNGTKGALTFFGRTQETADLRDTKTTFNSGLYANSVLGHINGTGNLVHYDAAGNEVSGAGGSNTIVTTLDQDWYQDNGGGFGTVSEHFVEDASYVKLKELNFSYKFSSFKNKYLQGITVGVFGRNLLLFTKYSGVDPETSLVGSGSAQGLDYFNNPSTRTFGLNLKFNF